MNNTAPILTSPLLTRLCLIGLLIFSQVLYAWHDVESLGSDHIHSSECVVCLSEHNSYGVSSATGGKSIEYTTQAGSAALPASIPASLSRFQPIRAPPISH